MTGFDGGGTTGPMSSPSGASSRSTITGRVVARAGALARLTVDPRGLHAAGHRPAREDQVDPHAEVLMEHAGAVVPVAEDALVRPAVADDVVQAEALELRERLALRRRDVRLPDVRLGIEDVVVGGRDVHVAGHDHVLRPGSDHLLECGEPFELVRVVLRARLAPIRHVHRDDPNAATGRGDRTRLLMRKPGSTLDALDDVLEPDLGQDRDPVPSGLAISSDLIAPISELIPEYLSQRVIRQLGLLKTNNIRPPLIEPRQKPRHALLERVDIPGGDAHGPQGTHLANRCLPFCN